MKKLFITLLAITLFISCEMKKYENDADSFSEIPDVTEDADIIDTDVEAKTDETEDASDIDNETPDVDHADTPCGSVYFNGVDSYISVEHDDALNLGKTWTIEAWVMQDSINGQNPIIRKGDETDTPSFWMYGKSSDMLDGYISTPNGGFQYGTTDTESLWLQSKIAMNSMKWFHVALSKSESQTMLFVNGILQKTIDSVKTMHVVEENLYFGARLNDNPSYFAGLIDEVRFSSTTRYPENFTPEKRLESDFETIAVWHFDEESGTETTSEGANILKGILNGSAEFVKNCNFRESECDNDCFKEGETRCSEGMLQTCRKNNSRCLEYINEACEKEICGNSTSCAVDNCPFPGASECVDGEIRVCLENKTGLLDWSKSKKCIDENCADETSCLVPANECEYFGQTKCSDGKITDCIFADNILAWSEETACIRNECINGEECKHEGWKVVSGMPACGISNSGELFCWFFNKYTPKKISTKNNWIDLSILSSYLCAIESGELFCGTHSENPDPIYNLSKKGSRADWTDISLSSGTNCGIAGGELFCWKSETDSPSKVGDRNDWEKVDGNCGIASGQIYCWNSFPPDPTLADSQNDWEQVSSYSDSHTCGIRNGELFCWGRNDYGQVGDGTNENRDVPTKIGTRNDWNSINCSSNYSCGIAEGEMFCWGSNQYGNLGIGAPFSTNIPQKVGSKNSWESVSLNSGLTYGISSGDIFFWGLNYYYILSMATLKTPVTIEQQINFNKVSAGENHICGVSNGMIFCNNIVEPSGPSSFFQVSGEYGWFEISSGHSHGCAINDGSLYCMGDNSSGQLGDGTFEKKDALTKVGTGTDWNIVSSGDYHTCAIADKELYCWGKNTNGQLGDGTLANSSIPKRITSPASGWERISSGSTHTCGIADGEMYCWGDNTNGQLGSDVLTSSTSPVRVGNKNDWEKVMASSNSTCGITNGELFCWGYLPKLIVGAETNVFSPTKISPYDDITKMAATTNSLCALRENGHTYCWNTNNVIPYFPAPIYPERITQTEWIDISGNSSTLCGITKDDQLQCINMFINYYLSPQKLINP